MANYLIEKIEDIFTIYYYVPTNKCKISLTRTRTLYEAVKYVILEGKEPVTAVKFDKFKLDKETRGLIAIILREARTIRRLDCKLEAKEDLYSDDYVERL